jgi:hypothetical protein
MMLLPTSMLPLTPMLLPAMLLPSTMLSRIPTTTTTITWCMRRRRHLMNRTTLQIHKDASLVLLRAVLQAQLLANLLHARFNLLHMILAMISLSNNNVQMSLSLLSRYPDPFLQHIFGFFDEQAVEVDGVASDAALGVVLAENVVARLAIVLVHLCCMLFAFFGEFMGACAVAGGVGGVRAVEA